MMLARHMRSRASGFASTVFFASARPLQAFLTLVPERPASKLPNATTPVRRRQPTAVSDDPGLAFQLRCGVGLLDLPSEKEHVSQMLCRKQTSTANCRRVKARLVVRVLAVLRPPEVLGPSPPLRVLIGGF